MMDYLDSLRRKPKHVRQRIALTSTIFIFSVIFGIWYSTFTLSASPTSLSIKDTLTPVTAFTSMIGDAGRSVNDFTHTFKGQMQQLQYEASSTAATDNAAALPLSDAQQAKRERDIVYPEEVYDARTSTDTRTNNDDKAQAAEPVVETKITEDSAITPPAPDDTDKTSITPQIPDSPHRQGTD